MQKQQHESSWGFFFEQFANALPSNKHFNGATNDYHFICFGLEHTHAPLQADDYFKSIV